MGKYNFKIGDTFLSWRVVACVDDKSYTYLCRCTECGSEKSFNKYNLLRGYYSPCKQCGHKKITNAALIKKHWNSELNGSTFTTPEAFSLTQSYWFMCNNGHNFKSSIKDFSLDRCLGCKTKVKDDSNKIQVYEFAYQYFSSVFNNVKMNLNHDQEYTLIIEDVKTVILFNEKDRFNNYLAYYDNENSFLVAIDHQSQLKQDYISRGYEFIKMNTSQKLKVDIDTLKQLMLVLIQAMV